MRFGRFILVSICGQAIGRHTLLGDPYQVCDDGDVTISSSPSDQAVIATEPSQGNEFTISTAPMSERGLLDAVKNKFLNKYPAKMNVSQVLSNITGLCHQDAIARYPT